MSWQKQPWTTPEPELLADLLPTRICRAREALETAKARHAKAAAAMVRLNTALPKGKIAREKADAALDEVARIAREIEHLEVAQRTISTRGAEL